MKRLLVCLTLLTLTAGELFAGQVSNSAVNYLPVSGQAAPSRIEDPVLLRSPTAFTVGRIYCRAATTIATGSYAMDLMVGGSPAGFTCALNSGAPECTATGSVGVGQGQTLSFRSTPASTPTLTEIQCSLATGAGDTATVRAYDTTTQAVANTTSVWLTFDSERFDTNSLHDTSSNTNRLTAPVDGVYLIHGQVSFTSNATGFRQAIIRLNGTTTIALVRGQATNGDHHRMQVSTLYRLVAGDYVELGMYQNSGGSLDSQVAANFAPEFGMALVDVGGASAAQRGNVSVKTGAYTLTEADGTIICDTSGGSFTLTLPAAATSIRRQFTIHKPNVANNCTIDPNASELIAGQATYVLGTRMQSLTVQSDGTGWIPVSNAQPVRFVVTTPPNVLDASSTRYIPPLGKETVQSTTEAADMRLGSLYVVGVECVMDNGTPDNGGGTQSFTMTLRAAGSATDWSCVISEAAASCSDFIGTNPVASWGHTWELVPAGTPSVGANRRMTCTIHAFLQ